MYKKDELIKEYTNGNYTVRIYEDGTKVRFTQDDSFNADFPESIDIKITNYCDMNCPMCHEESSINGIHGDLNLKFIDTLPSGIELAIGGGNPLSHPDLVRFLEKLKEKEIIANITINEQHLLKYQELINRLIDNKLIHGLGISLNIYSPITFEFARRYEHTVFHMIIGLVDIDRLINFPKGFKALFLGYKRFGRGNTYYNQEIENRIKEFEDRFLEFKNNFELLAFDNLALEQIHMDKHLPPEIYKKYYMGDDGECTMYIDLIKKEYAISSTSKTRYPLLDSIYDMFSYLKELN